MCAITAEAYSTSELPGADDTPLALHRWAPQTPSAGRGLLYYVHGIQSHAGWLFETGPELARRGVVTYALDRRGSGRSGGARGDLPSAWLISDDYLRGLHAVRRERPNLPVTVLGQSFGGSIVASLATMEDLPADRLVYCTPALGQQRLRHGVAGLARILQLTGPELSPITLDDEDYTDQKRYLEFMANDHLMLRQITERSRATMVELEQSYMYHRSALGAPVHFVRTASDPIIALDGAERALANLHRTFDMVTFPIDRHYVEFSSARRHYWDWLAEVVAPSVKESPGCAR
jgi:alpha-beta hydrolase superfamily lysophospholipase